MGKDVDVSPYAPPFQEKIDSIVEICAARFNVTVEQMKSKSRKTDAVKARRLAWYFFRHHLFMPVVDCGRVFGKDHATVLTGLKRLDDFIDIKTDGVLDSIEGIRESLYSVIDYTFMDSLREKYPKTFSQFIQWTTDYNLRTKRRKFHEHHFSDVPFDMQAKVFARFLHDKSKGKLDISPIFDLDNDVASDAVRFFFEYFEFRSKGKSKFIRRGRPRRKRLK